MARGTLAAMERRAKVIARKKGRTAVLEARRQVSIPFNSPQCDRKPLPQHASSDWHQTLGRGGGQSPLYAVAVARTTNDLYGVTTFRVTNLRRT